MSNQELYTQYKLIVTMLKKGDVDEVVEILENAIRLIDKSGATTDKEDDKQ